MGAITRRVIYYDPLTETNPEGEAEMLERISVGHDGLERWLVSFLCDNAIVERWVLATKGGH